ncbi:MAG: hypothetical protein QNJ98_14010 [Planctomycetota bacterium]|nr:hypothetical protein [Planctomycetota bacterium]
MLCALLVSGAERADAAPRRIRANGKWTSFHVKAPGGHHAFLFECRAGVRYRVTARPGTLARPVLELLWGAQAESSVRAGPKGQDEEVVLVWNAESDDVAEIRVRGFSAGTGKGKVKLESLDWKDEPAKPHQRFLGPSPKGGAFRVGDLLLGETNEWELVVEPGTAYEVRTTKGSAGAVRLRVLRGKEEEIAHSDAWRQAGVHFPTLRFRVPPLEPDTPLPSYRLVVEGAWSSAGTYGVRMTALDADRSVEPEILAPIPDVTRGLVEGQPLTFTLEEGDMAVLWVPEANPLHHRRVQMELREKWVLADGRDATSGRHGDFASGRRPGRGHFYSFRPYQPGTYRFTGGHTRRQSPSTLETLKLYPRDVLGAAPVHMGTNMDPTDKARTGSRWAPVGLAICVPGITYLFVCRGAPDAGVGMRVRTLDGKTVATRKAVGGAWPTAPGYGPSMRFRVPAPMVVRMEAKGGRKRIVRALLRELQSER